MTKKASSIASRNNPIIREDSPNIPHSGERAVSLVENAVACEWMNVDTFSDINYDIDSINGVKLKPEDFIVVKVELDIGSDKLIGPPHHIVFSPSTRSCPTLA